MPAEKLNLSGVYELDITGITSVSVANGIVSFTVPASSTSPGGANGSIQYNNSGAFGGFSDGTAHQVLHGGKTFSAVDLASDVTGLLPYASLSGTPQLPVTKALIASNFFTSYTSSTGAFTSAQPAFTDISGVASVAQIPNLPASIITSGQLALARGGTNSDLSGTGGTYQVLKQTSVGGSITVAQLSYSDLSGSVPAVTSIAETFTGGLISVAGSPVTTSGTFALTVAGTSGGIPYFSSTSAWASSALLAAGGLVLGGGSGITPATNTQLTFSAPTLTVGLAGTSSGILALTGSTSGSATFTAPAVAGTVTNNVTSSNGIQVPVGAQTTPSIAIGAATDGIFRAGAGILGTNSAWRFYNLIESGNSGVIWNANNSFSGSFDLGLFRDSTGVLAISNSSSNNSLGSLALAKITKYSSIATVSGGVPVEYATIDLTAQSAAIAATALYAVPAAGVGMYRISVYAKVTTAAGISSVLGGTNGFQIGFTDSTDSVAQTVTVVDLVGTALNSNSTTTVFSGSAIIMAKASTNITYAFDYTSAGTAMAYTLHVKLEAM